MTNGSKNFGTATTRMAFTYIALAIIGSALYGPADNTNQTDNTAALTEILIGLFYPSNHPFASILAIVIGMIYLIHNPKPEQ